jgi:type II secretory pathway pseudopilin PulG
MSIFLKLLLKHQVRSSAAKFDQNYQVKGMTMIELLVGTIIAFIVITPLMGMVLGLLNDDQRESAKANTEEEIQSALDYIGEDVSQALYIYVPKKQETTSSGTTTTDEIQSLKDNGFLPTDGTPVLVFWKRKLVEDSVPVGSVLLPNECNPKPYTEEEPAAAGQPAKPAKKRNCNDTYVLSLVSYQLLEKDTNPIWCQPLSKAEGCPRRIVRYEISDGLAKSDGTYYIEDDLVTKTNQNLKSYAKSSKDNLPYNSNFSLSKPLENVTDTTKIANVTQTVLVNYIEKFELDPSSTNNLAKLTIQANALRRNDAKADCTKNPNSPYCPKSSVQLRGLSGLGN